LAVFHCYDYKPPRQYAFVLFALYAFFLGASLTSEAGS
jgi:hypothetical protein